MQTIRIVALVLDTKQLILYREDGSSICLPQGDTRIRAIVDKALPIVAAGGVAEVSLELANDFAAFEKKSSGLVKFFRVAKKAVAHLLGADEDRTADPVEPIAAGKVPQVASRAAAAVNDIMAHAKSVSETNYLESETTDEHTLVAVVQTADGARVVPGVENLRGQVSNANQVGSTIGVENLIRRLGNVIDKRGHSVQDVLRFLESSDLRVADDGDIVAYKVLRRHPQLPDTFVDCHTGRIPQKVGSYVCVAEDLVDRNRRNECSNGLHIARRGYIKNFPGDVCVLVKIAPEDVVTVPHGDPNKVRVCGYHIIGLLSSEDFSKLRANRPMTEGSEATQRMLGKAIAGDHVGRLEEVRVTEQQGKGVTITNLKVSTRIAPQAKVNSQPAPKAVALDDPTMTAGVMDPKAVSETAVEAKNQAKEPTSRQVIARGLVGTMVDQTNNPNVRYEAAMGLVQLKKKAKISYMALGLAPTDIAMLEGMVANGAPTPVPTKIDLPAPQPVIEPKADAKPQTRQEKASYLLLIMTAGKTVPARISAARDLLALKKTSKVSWAALGVSDKQVKDIEYLTAPVAVTPAATPEKKATKTPAANKPKVQPRPEPSDPQQREALILARQGVSKREIERRTDVSARTVGRLLDQYGK